MSDMEAEDRQAWLLGVEEWMIRAALTMPDADERVRAWFDEAAEGDETYLLLCMRLWQDVYYLPVLELERRLAALRARRSAH